MTQDAVHNVQDIAVRPSPLFTSIRYAPRYGALGIVTHSVGHIGTCLATPLHDRFIPLSFSFHLLFSPYALPSARASLNHISLLAFHHYTFILVPPARSRR